MINPAKKYTIHEYIEILRRRIWYILIPFLVIVSGTVIYTIYVPREYKASTLVLVSPQRVPEAFVLATVTSKVEERLQSIAQEVLSRTRLEQIISEFKLYRTEQQNLSREEVVQVMQKNIKVELPNSRQERGYFTVSYINNDPNIATTVANQLASLFIEENLKLREKQAVGTTEFLSSELRLSKDKLFAMESSVAQYKKRFMGELPEQRDSNIKILEQLQNQYQRVGESLRAAQDRKLFIQKQLADIVMPNSLQNVAKDGNEGMSVLGKASSQKKDVISPSSTTELSGPYEFQKETLTKAYEELRAKYTENHPDVIAATKRLADLEKRKDTYQEIKFKNTYDTKQDPRFVELRNQMQTTDLEIKRLTEEEPKITAQIDRYRGRIERTPSREQDMLSLMREYESTKETYERLLKKNQDAQQAENMEKRQQGEQFRVIDPARVPEKPFSPNIPKILFLGLLAGVGCGLGLALIREQLDRSFQEPGDVEIALGFKVLATIPKIDKKTV